MKRYVFLAFFGFSAAVIGSNGQDRRNCENRCISTWQECNQGCTQ